MTTKIDRLTMIVAGLGSWTPYEGKVKEAETLLAEIERVCPEATTCPTCEKKLAKATDWEQVKIHNAVNAERRLNQGTIDGLTEALRQTDAECARLRALVEKAMRERDEARDCGQEGICAIAPGCQRHWAERNRELTALRPQDIIALGKYENQVADVKRGIAAAAAAQREKDAKIAEAEREKWAELALQAEIRKANAATDAGLEAAAQEAYEQRSRSGVAANIAAAIRRGES